MTAEQPLGSARVAALLGEQIHDVPSCFIAKLERRLQEFERLTPVVGHLSSRWVVPAARAAVTPCFEDLERHGKVAVPLRVMQALDAALEILHAEQIARRDGDDGTLLGDHLLEGLLIAGRELIKASAGTQLSLR